MNQNKDNSLERLPKILTALTTEEKKVFLADVIVQIDRICKYNRFDIDDNLIKDLAIRICKSNKFYERRMIITALDDFYGATIDFFSPMVLFNFVNEKVSYIARKQAEDKKKKENEKFLLSLNVELTPEQEAERIRKKEELEKMLTPINEKATKFTGFRKPFEKDEEYEKFKNSLK